MIHLQFRQSYLPDIVGQFFDNPGAPGNQNNVMACQSSANFDRSEQMSDAQNVLTVNHDFHDRNFTGLPAQRLSVSFLTERHGIQFFKL
jgi:hypothetical protein